MDINKEKNKSTENSLKVTVVPEHKAVNTQYYTHKRIEASSIVEGLKDEIDNMNPRTPILIDAGTGFGKTTFIYNECIPRAIEKNKNVMIVSNRIPLSCQQKKEIMRILESPKLEYLTDKGIENEDDFGCVRVITYHKLPSFVSNDDNKEWISNVMYVAFDEAHFFVADSLFNNKCDVLLKLATKTFRHSIRIYLTATSSELIKPLTTIESRNYDRGDFFTRSHFQIYYERNLIHYSFQRNYNNYNLNFFESEQELTELIENSDKDEKWMIFVNSKEMGKKLNNSIENSKYVDAMSKGSVIMKNIIENQNFPCRVLISTAVLDCGVNIIDKDLKHIAIITTDQTSMLQMIGRKRLSPDEKVNLWIKDMPITALQKEYEETQEKLSLINECDSYRNTDRIYAFTQRLWNMDADYLNKLFYMKDGKLFTRKLAHHKLKSTNYFLESILFDDKTFKSCVCEWLGKDIPNELSPLDILRYFCLENMGTELTDNQICTLRKLIVDAHEKLNQKEAQQSRKETMQIQALNNRLAKLDINYKITSNDQSWILIKTQREASE